MTTGCFGKNRTQVSSHLDRLLNQQLPNKINLNTNNSTTTNINTAFIFDQLANFSRVAQKLGQDAQNKRLEKQDLVHVGHHPPISNKALNVT